jgi:hypothetical protein
MKKRRSKVRNNKTREIVESMERLEKNKQETTNKYLDGTITYEQYMTLKADVDKRLSELRVMRRKLMGSDF